MRAAPLVLFALSLATAAYAEPPEALHPVRAPAPRYPRSEFPAEATCELSFIVDTRGRIETVSVTEESRADSCTPPFEAAALKAARRWRFTPAEHAGEPVKAKFVLRVKFKPAPEDLPAPSGGGSR
jgi:TonB family protein